MRSNDLGRELIDGSPDGDFWTVWNSRYGRTDGGDMGFVQRRDGRFVAFSRGDVPRELGSFDSLDAAVAALRSAY